MNRYSFSSALLFLACELLLAGVIVHHHHKPAPKPVPAITKPSALVNVGDAAHKRSLHRSVHLITHRTSNDGDKCTAAAIGPHALLTASHCEMPTDYVSLDEDENVSVTAHIVAHIRDNNDHTIYLLEGIQFTDIATFSASGPESGDDVFMWGNPTTFRDLYRRGYAIGTKLDTGDDDKKRTLTLYDLKINHGDSGAAIFDSEGHIVAVVSLLEGDNSIGGTFSFAASYPLAFTPAQLNKARYF